MAARLLEGILPPNATFYERTLASQVERLLALDTERLRNLWNPWKCHIDDLAYLAWSMSVDIWDPDWSEDKKRRVVADAVDHHRMKGTELGVATYLELVDAKLRELIVPPARGYRIPAMTNEVFLEWLGKLPQLRVYPFLIRDPAGPRDFRMPRYTFRNDNFREKSIGPSIYGRRATLYRQGVEVPVRLESTVELGGLTVDRLHFAGIVTRDFRSTGFRGHGFYELSDAADHIVTVRISQAASELVSITPGLTPQNVKPVPIYERHTPRPAENFRSFAKSFRGDGHFRTETVAAQFVYDRLSLHDKADLPAGLRAKWYRGHSRYGIQAFTAEAKVEVFSKRSPSRGFGGRFRNGFRMITDNSKLWNACDAIVAAKPLRDTVLVNTITHRVVRLGDRRKLGSFKLGEIKPVA
jgi:hypothetical protein